MTVVRPKQRTKCPARGPTAASALLLALLLPPLAVVVSAREVWFNETLPAAWAKAKNARFQLMAVSPETPSPPSARAVILHQGDRTLGIASLTAPEHGSFHLTLQAELNGIPQKLDLPPLRRFDWRKKDVLLLIDASTSMRRNDPKNLRLEAARQFIALARHSERIARIGIIAFQTEARLVLPLTPPDEIPDIRTWARRFKPRASTNFDAAFVAADGVLRRAQAKDTAILLLSDGRSMGRYRNRHLRLRDRHCPIYAIGLSAEADIDLLSRIAADTGGQVFAAPQPDQLQSLFIRIFQLLDPPQRVFFAACTIQQTTEIPLLLDADLRNPVLLLAPLAGKLTARIGDQAIRNIPPQSLRFLPLPPGGKSQTEIKLQGNARVNIEVMASTQIRLHPLPFKRSAPVRTPVQAWFYLEAGAANLQDVQLHVSCRDPTGTETPITVIPGSIPRLWSISLPTTKNGLYRLNVRATGQNKNTPFRRQTQLTFTRSASRQALSATEFRITLPVKIQPTPHPTTLRLPTAPTLSLEKQQPKTQLRETFWLSADQLLPGPLYPGTEASAELNVLVNTPQNTPTSIQLKPEKFPGIQLTTKGTITPGIRSRLTLRAQAAPDSAGRTVNTSLRLKCGTLVRKIPVRISVKTPKLTARLLPVRILDEQQSVTAETILELRLAPAGTCPITIRTDLPQLTIESTHFPLTSLPRKVRVRLTLPRPLAQIHQTGTITVSAPGLKPLRLPFQVEFTRRRLPPPPLKPLLRTTHTLHNILPWLLIALLAALLTAALRGNRRAALILLSIALHLLLLLVVLPHPKKQKPQTETVMRVSAGKTIHEESIRAETATTSKHTEDARSAKTSKKQIQNRPTPKPETQKLTPKKQLHPLRATAKSVAPQPVKIVEIQPESLPHTAPNPTKKHLDHPKGKATPTRAGHQPAKVKISATPKKNVTAQVVKVVTPTATLPRTAPLEKTPTTPAPPQLQPRDLSRAAEKATKKHQNKKITKKQTQPEDTPPEKLAVTTTAAPPAHAPQKISVQPAAVALRQSAQSALRPLQQIQRPPISPTRQSPAGSNTSSRRKHVQTVATNSPPPGLTAAATNPAVTKTTTPAPRTVAGKKALPTDTPNATSAADLRPAATAPATAQKASPPAPTSTTLFMPPAATTGTPRKHAQTANAPATGPANARIDGTAALAASTLHLAAPKTRRIDIEAALHKLPATTNFRPAATTPTAEKCPTTTPTALAPTAVPPRRRRQTASQAQTVQSPATASSGHPVKTLPNRAIIAPATGDAQTLAPETVATLFATVPTQNTPIRPKNNLRPRQSPPLTPLTNPTTITRQAAHPIPATTTADALMDEASPQPLLATTGAKPQPPPLATTALTPNLLLAKLSSTAPQAQSVTTPAPAPALPQPASIQLNAHGRSITKHGKRRPAPTSNIVAIPGAIRRPIQTAAPVPASPRTTRIFRPASPPLARINTRTASRPPPAIQLDANPFAPSASAWRRTLPLLQYGGDWDCDRTAMPNLAHQLEQRTGSVLPFDSRTLNLANSELTHAPFLFMSGHRDFQFTPPEIARLRQYLNRSGYLWINDSTDLGDEQFDRAVRREIKRLYPQSIWQRLPPNHPIFRAPYDLTHGYLGYTIPPGDKYRTDYIEAIIIHGQPRIIYTRNDYGDGMEIDPRTHPLMASLTDLSPAEMQEGALRMGINIASFFLNRGQLPDATISRKMNNIEQQKKKHIAAILAAPVLPLPLLDTPDSWHAPTDWPDTLPATITSDKQGGFTLEFKGNGLVTRRSKAVVSRSFSAEISRNRILILDVNSQLTGGARLAIAFDTPSGYLESAPVYLKPGNNPHLLFDLRQSTFKSAASNWEYRVTLPKRLQLTTWHFILYPQQSQGRVTLLNLSLHQPPPSLQKN